VRVAANELGSARFNALLAQSVARNTVSAIDVLLTLTEGIPIANF